MGGLALRPHALADSRVPRWRVQGSTLSCGRRMEGMRDLVWCFVEMPGIIVLCLDVSVDVAPLLTVARAIRARLATEWMDRLVRTLLRERPLA